MTYAIAAAGTGGHVYPGLAVAEALVDSGVDRDEIVFIGGNRMEAKTVPAAGYPFIELELQGLKRNLTPENLGIPRVVRKASLQASSEFSRRGTKAVLAMGGYVTVPVGMAARRSKLPLVLHEQNAHAGLANRFAARWAARVFMTFPNTTRLKGEIIGNPLRAEFVGFDEAALRDGAMKRYGLDDSILTLGVFGGSLGAGALNTAVAGLARDWSGKPLQIVHLVGSIHVDATSTDGDSERVTRRVVGFENDMAGFYAASDLLVARAGGSLYEVAATGTPTIAVPGTFGGGHQAQNAAAMVDAGAAIVLEESRLGELGAVVDGLMTDSVRRSAMADAARRVARPDAARVVAAAMMELAHA